MELGTLANVAEIIGAVLVLGGVSFAIIEINHFRQQRRDMAAIELSRSFQNPEFARALRVVLSLPSGITAEQMRDGDPAWEDAAMLVSLTLESVGIMVHRRIVSIDMVWELMGGVALSVWDRLEAWAAIRHSARAPQIPEVEAVAGRPPCSIGPYLRDHAGRAAWLRRSPVPASLRARLPRPSPACRLRRLVHPLDAP